MGYIFSSMMRDYERNRNKRLKAAENQRAEKAAADVLNRLIAGVRCPKCWQEAYAAKVVPVVPANAGVRLRPVPPSGPPTVNCTCPQGHRYQVQDGRLVPPQPGRRAR